MPKRIIGIDISGGTLHAVQVLHGSRGVAVERVCNMPFDHDPQAAIGSLRAEHGFARRAMIAVAMPDAQIFFQTLETDLTNLDQIRQTLAYDIEDDVPVPFEKLLADVCDVQTIGARTRLLVAAASRDNVEAAAKMSADNDIRADIIDAAPCALLEYARIAQPDTTADGKQWGAILADSNRLLLIVCEGRHLRVVRNLAGGFSADVDWDSPPESAVADLAREVQLAWRSAFRAAMPGTATLLLCGRIASAEGALADLCGCRVQGLHEPEQNDRHEAASPVALGLARRAAGGRSLNLLAADAEAAYQTTELRRQGVFSVVLVLLLCTVWFAGSLARLNRLEAANRRLDGDIRKAFAAALPDETVIVNELAQMEQRLQTLRNEHQALSAATGAGISPLRILADISESMPHGRQMDVTEMQIGEQNVRISGRTGSFESVDALRERLAGLDIFEVVSVRDAVLEPTTGQVRFALQASLRRP